MLVIDMVKISMLVMNIWIIVKFQKNMKFDRIVSVGMLEHVGSKNFDEYFKVVHDHLHKKW